MAAKISDPIFLSTGSMNEIVSREGPYADDLRPVEVLRAFSPFIKFYRFMGYLPISIEKGYTGLTFKRSRPYWIFSIVSLTMQLALVVTKIKDAVRASWKSPTPAEYMELFNEIVYDLQSFVLLLLILVKVRSLPRLISAWEKGERVCDKYNPERKDRLVLQSWVLYGTFTVLYAISVGLFYWSWAIKVDLKSIQDYGNTFQFDSGGSLDALGLSGWIGLAMELHASFGWIFGDLIVILLSLCIGRYFKRLNGGIQASKAETIADIEQLRLDNLVLHDLVQECNDFFGPIILTTFLGNFAFLLSRLYAGISNDIYHSSLLVRWVNIYSVSFLISKIILPTWLAAQLSEVAEEALQAIRHWKSKPDWAHGPERLALIGRFVSEVTTHPVALSAQGYFFITKSFFISMIGVLITYQIIIVQFKMSEK